MARTELRSPVERSGKVADPRWRKSSFSGMAECVQVAEGASGQVLVGDSKDPFGTVLACTREAFRAFIEGAKNGSLDT